MKKKPELFKKTGKSSLILRNFLNNLKENDLHYENKQITQCVFLGVLRLKPVPSIFNSNSVPSVSAPVTENVSETVQSDSKNNGNKKLKKNISRNNDITKVLNGKVSKKNPQQVKAAVRKVPVKKSNIIKIKLNPKKKIVKDKKPSSPSHDQEISVLASTSQSKPIASHSFLTTPTISLNSVISPTKFNPVQNLFDKLKQKIDESSGEPGTSKILKHKCKFREMVDISETASKVCKMNANRQPKGASTKRYKNILQRNPETQVRVAMPEKTPSPITISDSESTGKKSEDDVTIVTDESNLSVYQSVLHNANSNEVSMEDVIIVNDDPKPNAKSRRSKERVSEKNRNETSLRTTDIIVINDDQGPTKTKCGSLLKPNEISARLANETSIRSHGPNQPCDIIVIPDEPNIKQKNKSSVINERIENNIAKIQKDNKQDISKSEVVIVGEAREVRVSPRLKKTEIMKERSIDKEQSKFSNKEVETVADEVIVITEDALIPKESNFISDAQQNTLNLYITDSAQNKINKEKTSQGLLKTVEGTTIEVGKQLPETSNSTMSATVTNEKPKQRKNRLKSPLIPPELLTPMLLRSDLAPKKTNYAVTREKFKAIKPKEKSASRLLRSDIEQAAGKKQAVKLNDAGFIAHNQNKNETESRNESSINVRSDPNHRKNLSISPLSISDSSSSSTSEEIILVDEQKHIRESRGGCFNKLLKSSLIRQKNKETSPSQVNQSVEGHLEAIEAVDSTNADITCQANLYHTKTMDTSVSEILIQEKVVVVSNEQIRPVEKRATTRLLRSDLLHQKIPKTCAEESKNTEKPCSRLLPLEVNKTKERSIVTVKEELNENISPMLLRSDITKQESQANSTGSKECSLPSKNETQRSVQNQSSKPIAGTHQIQTLGKVIEIEKIGERGKALVSTKSLRKKKSLPSETQHTPSLGNKQSQTNDNEVIIIKEEPKHISPHSRNSNLLQDKRRQDTSEENILVIEDDTVSLQKKKIIPRLLRSDINRQKSEIKSPEKYKDTDLNEIVVISDNKMKEPKDKSNGRLSQSELSTRKIKKKSLLPSEAEKVVVLIHDEPKTKESDSSTSNAVIQEISQYEQGTDISNVQESSAKESTTKTNEKSSTRFLRSDATFKQDKIKYDIDEIETKIAVKTEIIEDRSLNRYVKSTTSCRLLRSSMNYQHNTYSDTNEERNVKQSLSTRSLRSRNSLQNSPTAASFETEESTKFGKQNLRSPRSEKGNFPDILSIEDMENIESKQLGSSSILRSEGGSQSERQNSTGKQSICFESGSKTIDETEASSSRSSRLPTTPKRKLHSLPKQQCKSSENLLISIKDKFPKRKSKSLLMDSKQKTTMLLRSELAQLKTVDPYGKQEAKTSLIKKRKSTKVMPSPLANVNRLEQENVITNERKIPKRKSLIAELKKRNLAKEKEMEIHTVDNNQSLISRHEKTFEDTSKIENQDHNLNNDIPTENHIVEQNSPKRKSRSQNKIFESDSAKKLIDNVCISVSVEENENRAAKKGTLRQIKDSKENKQTRESDKNEAMDNVTQKTDTTRLLTKRSLSFNKKQNETEENKSLNCDYSSVIVVPSEEENLKSEKTVLGRKRSLSSKQKLRKITSNEEISVNATSQDDAVAAFCENIKLEENEPTEHKQKSSPSKEKLKETNVGTVVIPDNASQDVNATTLSPENAAIGLNKNKPRRQRSLSYKRKRKLKEAVETEENKTLNKLLQYNIDTSSSGGFKIQPSEKTSERQSSSPKRQLKQIKRSEKMKSSEENNSASIITEKVILEPQETNATSEKSPENKEVMVIPQETKLQVDAKIQPKQRGRSPRRNLRGVNGNPKNKPVEEGSSQINTLPITEKNTSEEISSTSKQKTNRHIKQTKPTKTATKALRQDSGTLISSCDTHKTVTPKRRKVKQEETGVEEDIISNKLGTTGNINVPSSSDVVKTEPEGVVLRQRSPTVKHKLKDNKDNPAYEVPNHLDNKNISLSEDISQSTLPAQKKLSLKRRSKQSNENKVKVPQESNSSMSSPEGVNLNLAVESPAKQKEKRISNKRTLKEAEITKGQKITGLSTNENPPGSNIVVPSPKEVKSVLNENKRKGNRRRTSAKRKSVISKKTPEKLAPAENISEGTSLSNSIKKIDTTVFDFDESEPEVIPLRLSNSAKKEKGLKLTLEESKDCKQPEPGITPKLKKQKAMLKKTSADTSITKAETKTKLSLFGEKSPQSDIQLALEKSTGEHTNSKTGTSLNSSKQADNKILLSSPLQDTIKTENNKSVLSEKIASPTKSSTSPLKQATITDMFNRVLAKREKAAVADSVFGPPNLPEKSTTVKSTDNIITNMPPPRAGKMMPPPPPPLKPEETEYYDDDDSDCDSRMEWIPEEYAEYKFKYSAKKMMSYKPIHKCKICLLILPSYYKLCKHKKEHAKKENPYDCTQCDQSFSSIENLTAHLRIHKGKHPYTCTKCDVGFWSKKALDAHTPIHVLKKIKQPNKRFRCDVCLKEFSKLCDMERHTRVHTGEKPVVCNICNKGFQQSHNLSKHLLIHLHVKPYHCEICNKQFGRNDVLNRHLLTHSVDKPLKCPHCPKSFIRQLQLTNHVKKYHSGSGNAKVKEESKAVEAN